MKRVLKLSLVAACLSIALSSAHAQVRIFAVSGTVTSINPKIKMTELTTDDGTSGHFRWIDASTAIDFNKNVSADSIPAEKFATKGDHVIAYYFGDGDLRTLVAVHDLGAGPVAVTTGTVVKLNRKEHVLTVKKTTGEEATMHLDPKTVVTTSDGVMTAFKYDLDKGAAVRVTSSSSNGSDTALLVTPAY